MDLYFPRDEQRLLFEKFDTEHSMRLSVSNIIAQSQEDLARAPPNAGSIKVDSEVKDLILHKIDEQRVSEKLVSSPRQTRLQLKRTLRNLDPESTGYISKDQLKWALGEKYLNLHLSDDEIQAAADLCPPSPRSGQINYDKFVRVLNIRNSDPIGDPLFDAKANNITRLRQRVKQLQALESDPALLKRRDELLKICMVGPGPQGITKYLDPERVIPIPELDESETSHPVKQIVETLSRNVSGKNSPIRSVSQSRVQSPNSTMYSSAEYNDRRAAFDHDNFRPTVNHPSRTKVKYPLTIELAEAHGGHSEPSPGGRRRGPENATNWGLIHHEGPHSLSGTMSSSALLSHVQTSGDFSRSLSSSTLYGEPERYRSTQAEYYTPLEYQPSMPVTRPGVIGDAMKCALEREVCICCIVRTSCVCLFIPNITP
jgi:hypothetical protein